MVGPCLGADHTKEFLSFGRQPSLFKGRNQSWFHPLRTPSRPGAAAPGPHGGQRAGEGAFACHRPAAMHRPPAARFRDSFVIVSRFESKAGLCPRCHARIPAAHLICHPSSVEPRDRGPGIATFLREGNLPWGRPHEGIPVLWETTFVFQRVKPIVVSPFENPFPTRGRGPWTPRGAANSRWFLRMPSTGRAHRPPAARS